MHECDQRDIQLIRFQQRSAILYLQVKMIILLFMKAESILIKHLIRIDSALINNKKITFISRLKFSTFKKILFRNLQ